MRCYLVLLGIILAGTSCKGKKPDPWNGPQLSQPRTQLTLDQLSAGDTLELLDMSFFARPDWAGDSSVPFSGTVSLGNATMNVETGWSAPGGTTFPPFTVDFISDGRNLIPRVRGLLEPDAGSERYWDVILGTGAVWSEDGDSGWDRGSFPLSLLGRYVGEVRNCVATFVFSETATSNVYVQCSQETAVLDAAQLGDIRAVVPATYEPKTFPDTAELLAAHEAARLKRIPDSPLSNVDRTGEIAAHFDSAIHTNASTSLGAIYLDGTLYVHPPRTRHGVYPYPGEMRHGVFSVTKSMAGALAMFYFAQRYGESIFDELVVEHVPAFVDLPEWQGVTFSHLLNMVTGTRAGESGELLYEPLELAPDSETAIGNIAQFGDFPEAPGEKFNYATTNTFVLSYALENYVQHREGQHVHYWDLVRDNVLVPIGAEGFEVLYTRDEEPSERVPILGLGGVPTLDHAAKIARLIAAEGEHDGAQLLNRNKIREALGRTDWEGYPAFDGLRYRHSFWSKTVQKGGCAAEISFMEGLGDNRILLFPSGAISLQFTDEFDRKFDRLARAVEELRSSCQVGHQSALD